MMTSPTFLLASSAFLLGSLAKVCAKFTYREQNNYGYTYDPDNVTWSYVPCDYDLNCRDTTGNYRTACLPEGTNTSFVCVCNSLFGFNAPNCSYSDMRPECVSGPDACDGDVGIVGLVAHLRAWINSVMAAYVVFSSMKISLALWRLHRSFRASVTTSLFTTLASFGLFVLTASDIFVEFEDGTKTRLALAGMAVVFLALFTVASLSNISIMWHTAVNSIRNLRTQDGSNLKRAQASRMTFIGVTISAALIVCVLLEFFIPFAIINMIALLGYGVYFCYWARQLAAIVLAVKSESMKGTGRTIQTTARRVGRLLLTYLTFQALLVFVLGSLSFHSESGGLIRQSATFALYTTMTMLFIVLSNYCASSVKAKRRASVTPTSALTSGHPMSSNAIVTSAKPTTHHQASSLVAD